ncbi:PKD-like family lipoprotein [Carboxylicivirga taeanensis]|uniref:PKD-like family lipoprotein n=1 Tax=Carboxylicivirga taeanensis TaxID=1416875 RepID=UPI003F6E3A2A
MKKYLYIVFVSVSLLTSCYKDEGNYDYREINELSLEGIELSYDIDLDDTLKITPQLIGTLYNDTSQFTYRWEINRSVVAESLNLAYRVKSLGNKLCRFIVHDKETEVETAQSFDLNVSSATAGDAILVLSNYKNRAELSYKRIDRDGTVFVPNYYLNRTGEELGINPKSLHRSYFSFGGLSGLQVLTEEGLRCLDHNTLDKYESGDFIDESFFLNYTPVYPVPEMPGFKVESVDHIIGMWNFNPYGGINRATYMSMVSGGRYYYGYWTGWTKSVYVAMESELGGQLSPVTFSAYRKPDLPAPDYAGSLVFAGYKVSLYTLLFDKSFGKFMYSYSGGQPRTIAALEENIYSGLDLIYGTHTSQYNNCVAVLANASTAKMILMQAPGDRNEEETKPFQILGEVNVSASLVNSKSKFYAESYGNYIYFTSGNGLHKYNFRDIASGSAPTAGHKVLDLTQYGYDDKAEITAMHVTRTEKSIILGVSRYGSDFNGESDELKGDVLIIENQAGYQLIEKNEGVAGYPVDVMIKHKSFYRDGIDKFGVLQDKY